MEGKYIPKKPVDGQVKRHHGLLDFANLFKSFVGTQYMTLSYGFYQSGVVLGVIGIGLVALLTGHCCHMLVKCKYYTIEHVCSLIEGLKTERGKPRYSRDDIQTLAATMQKRLTYTDIGYIVYGRVGSTAVSTCLLLTQIGFCVGYHIFIGNVLLTLILAALNDSSADTGLTTQSVMTTQPTHQDNLTEIYRTSQDSVVNRRLLGVIEDTENGDRYSPSEIYVSDRVARDFPAYAQPSDRNTGDAEFQHGVQNLIKDFSNIDNDELKKRGPDILKVGQVLHTSNGLSASHQHSMNAGAGGGRNGVMARKRNIRDVDDVDPEDSFNVNKELETIVNELESGDISSTSRGRSHDIESTGSKLSTSDGDHDYNVNTRLEAALLSLSLDYAGSVTDADAVSGDDVTTDGMEAGVNATSTEEVPPEAKSDLPIDPQYLLMLLSISPLPLFMIFTLFRKVRGIGPISVIANFTVILGFVVVTTYICIDFTVGPGVELATWTTFPVLLGQGVASYEAIGTLLSIEGSMEGNQYRFGSYLTAAIFSFTSLFTPLALLGYAKYGVDTEQILLLNLPQDSVVLIIVEITTLIGVLCTYPIQVFPVTELAEQLAFGRPKGTEERSSIGGETPLMSSMSTSTMEPSVEDHTPLLEENDCLRDLGIKVTSVIPKYVPTWKRNLLRFFIALLIASLALIFRNAYAYAGALVGALGSTPLAFIFPCLLQMKLLQGQMSLAVKIKNIFIMVATGILSVGIVVIVIAAVVYLA